MQHSIINSCPPEIWSQIVYQPCTDTGFTGRSISATSRYFHEIAKKVRLRSVALFTIEQIIAFVKLVEGLPSGEPLVENLYILLTYDFPARRNFGALSQEFYKPGFDTRVSPPPMRFVLNSPYELCRHVLLRILHALAPTLKHLHIFFDSIRLFILPFADLPHLEELVVEEDYSYNDQDFANDRPPLLASLRRLRLTGLHDTNRARDTMFRTIVASAPNLTHLRLDNFLYSLNAYNVIQKFLPPEGLAPAVANPDGNERFPPPRPVKTLPKSLRRMLLHPGSITRQWREVFGDSMDEQMDESVFLRLALTDPRIILFKQDPFTLSVEAIGRAQKGLDEWLDRNNGGESYWSTCNKL